MKLYLVRHGDAVPSTEDSKRPLSEQGCQEVATMAQFLQSNNITVQQLYHSGKERALETAKILAGAMQTSPKIDPLIGLQPDDSPKTVAAYSHHWDQDVMLVGHLPFMAKLVAELLFEREDRSCIDFPTAGIVCLERIALIQWCVSWFIYPALLKNK